MTNESIENPFRSKYVFSATDLKRDRVRHITLWERFLLRILPMYVQKSEGYRFYYKYWKGRYYLLKVRKES